MNTARLQSILDAINLVTKAIQEEIKEVVEPSPEPEEQKTCHTVDCPCDINGEPIFCEDCKYQEEPVPSDEDCLVDENGNPDCENCPNNEDEVREDKWTTSDYFLSIVNKLEIALGEDIMTESMRKKVFSQLNEFQETLGNPMVLEIGEVPNGSEWYVADNDATKPHNLVLGGSYEEVLESYLKVVS